MAQPNIPLHTLVNATPVTVAGADDFLLPTEAAYQKLLPEIQAVPEQDLATVNIDVMAAITTVTGTLPELRALRAPIEAEWRNFNFEHFDKLEEYTLALNHAHSLYRTSLPQEDVSDVVAELTRARDDLLANASSLARFRLIDGKRLESLKTLNGHRALASDVLTLCAVFREDWARVAGKTPFTPAELQRVAALALSLVSKLGLREQMPVVTAEPSLIRQKAFTLVLRTYNAARRAVHYLRFEQRDAEKIAPSLYMNRTGRKKSAVAGQESVAVAAPALDASDSGKPLPTEASADTPAPRIVIDNVAGLPMDYPFIN